jgi:pimeloyl-ACP methyl ester carboxylesterase
MMESGGEHPDFSALWDVIGASTMPLLLARGMLSQSVVDDADEAELLRRRPDAVVLRVENAGHSIQGDQPVELARILQEFLTT